jgi:hypothetical protein
MARCVMLAMPDNETNRLGAPLHDALDGIGHLAQIHCVLDLCAAAFRLDNDGVVHFYAVIARRGEFRVKVQRLHPEARVLASNDGKHLLRGVRVIILVVVEIGQDNVLLQAIGDRLQFRGRREASADNGVEMRVVPIERNVAEQRQAQCSGYDAGIGDTRQTAPQIERQAQPERENQQYRCAPGAKKSPSSTVSSTGPSAAVVPRPSARRNSTASNSKRTDTRNMRCLLSVSPARAH